MSRLLIFLSIIISVHTSFAMPAFQVEDAGDDEVMETTFKPRRQIATIVYMGLAGAVLGLSTLSFYGRPQDRLTNIAVGFGAGVVIGAVYMTYKAATDPAEMYRSEMEQEEARIQETHHWLLGARQSGPKWSMRWEF